MLEPPVAINPQTGVVWAFRGEPLELLCRYRSIVSVTIVWRKNGQNLNSNERLVFYTDGRLVILNVTDSDEGMYRCEIRSREGNVNGYPLNVTLAGVLSITFLPLHFVNLRLLQSRL